MASGNRLLKFWERLARYEVRHILPDCFPERDKTRYVESRIEQLKTEYERAKAQREAEMLQDREDERMIRYWRGER